MDIQTQFHVKMIFVSIYFQLFQKKIDKQYIDELWKVRKKNRFTIIIVVRNWQQFIEFS